MKTAHSLAHELLEGPDLPVAVPKVIEYNDNPEDSCAEPILAIVDGRVLDDPSKIVLITYAPDDDKPEAVSSLDSAQRWNRLDTSTNGK